MFHFLLTAAEVFSRAPTVPPNSQGPTDQRFRDGNLSLQLKWMSLRSIETMT